MGELFRGEARRRQNSPLAPEPKNHHTKPDKQPCAGRKQGGNYLVPRAVANERKQRKKEGSESNGCEQRRHPRTRNQGYKIARHQPGLTN